jgi:hypothetical protein
VLSADLCSCLTSACRSCRPLYSSGHQKYDSTFISTCPCCLAIMYSDYSFVDLDGGCAWCSNLLVGAGLARTRKSSWAIATARACYAKEYEMSLPTTSSMLCYIIRTYTAALCNKILLVTTCCSKMLALITKIVWPFAAPLHKFVSLLY